MGLKSIIPVSAEVSTASGFNGVTNLVSCNVPSDCDFIINDIFIVGRTTSGTIGQIGSATAVWKGKRVSGTVSTVGSIVYLMTFTTGSESGHPFASCQIQFSVTGTNLFMNIRTPSTLVQNVDWYGGFTLIMN